MKQEMNLTHFVCNDANAIQNMLYFTMIAAMLVLIYKKRNGIRSFKMAKIQFFKELTYSILLDILEEPQGWTGSSRIWASRMRWEVLRPRWLRRKSVSRRRDTVRAGVRGGCR